MSLTLSEALLIAGVYFFNIPFGYWRARTEKFSKEWILAIHMPVPLVFLGRILSGVPVFHIPVLIFFFFLGQLSGVKIRSRLENFTAEQLSRCMVMDIVRILSCKLNF